MTQRLAEMRVRINSVRQLGSAITALRGIAASHVQQSRGRLAGVRTYSRIIAEAISQAVSLLPERGEGVGSAVRPARGLLVFCAELGFAGAFSEEMLDQIGERREGDRVYCVGSRGVVLARSRRLDVVWSAPMISQVGGVAALAGRIVAALEQDIREHRITGVEMIFRRPGKGNDLETQRRKVLPVDMARFGRREGGPPLTNIAPAMLLERLAGEYLFAQISEAILHSFAAENLARLTSMASAKENIDRKLEALGLEERMARQGEITDEVIELSAGAASLDGR